MKQWWVPAVVLTLVIAVFLSPFANPNPDGLNRVAKDQGFDHKETKSLATNLPFAQVFDRYTVRGIENPILAKALAGLGGSLVVLGGAWGLGWWLRRRRTPS